MKLYELKRGDHFKVEGVSITPPDLEDEAPTETVFTFHNVDGMYSYITDQNGAVHHFAAWTEVERVDG